MLASSLVRGFVLSCLFVVVSTAPVAAQSMRSSAAMTRPPQSAGRPMQGERFPFAPAGAPRMRIASATARQEMVAQPELQPADGQVIEGPMMHEQAFAGDYVDGPLMGGCDDGCASCPPPFAALMCLPGFNDGAFSIQAGSQAFSGPANRGGTGSFGFHEGFNWGGTFPFSARGISAQIGAVAVQSNFQGANFTTDNRNQIFATAGLFRRVDAGLQGGVVFDYMHDQWYYDLDLGQIRGEVSWVFGCGQEVGFWGAGGFSDKSVQSTLNAPGNLLGPVVLNEVWKSNEIFAFFYRQKLCAGGEARGYGGFTGNGDGIVGADFLFPLGGCFDLKANALYLIPAEDVNNGGLSQESWNLSVGLVWYPGCRVRCPSPYDRPLFNVADNGSFLIDRQ